MSGGLRPGEVVNLNGWPVRVEQNSPNRPLVVQSLMIEEIQNLGRDRIGRLGLSPETTRRIAQGAGLLDLLESSAA